MIMVRLQPRMVWLTVEQEREKNRAVDADFSEMHEISRHATHSTETLSATMLSMEAMRARHKNFHQRSHATTTRNACWITTQQHMELQGQLIRNFKLRSQANQERLQSEITLVLLSPKDHHRVCKRDSRLIPGRPTT